MSNTNIQLGKLRQNTQKLNVIRYYLSDEKLTLNDIHQEKGASIWLLTLPLKDKGYCLNKQEFLDLVKVLLGHYHGYLQKRQFYDPKTQPYQKCNH